MRQLIFSHQKMMTHVGVLVNKLKEVGFCSTGSLLLLKKNLLIIFITHWSLSSHRHYCEKSNTLLNSMQIYVQREKEGEKKGE